MVLSHRTTPWTGVIGGVVTVALAIALFLVFRHRRKATENPQTPAFGPEGGSPYIPGDVVTQAPISPRLSGQQTHQKFYVSLQNTIGFELYRQARLSCV